MNPDEWHQRYRQQAGWTHTLRQHLFTKAGIQAGDRVLEVGSGTGAVLQQMANEFQPELTGVDRDRPSLIYAQRQHPTLAQGDGRHLPFQAGAFSAAYCHYLLLWVNDPQRILHEMRRVTRPGGAVIALAEPDHAARIDYPPPLDLLGRLQTAALQAQGADVTAGRQLSRWFHQAGLTLTETGLLGAEWNQTLSKRDDLEWQTLLNDLEGEISSSELSAFREEEKKARAAGERVLFIPTFYAIGFVP